MKLPDAYLGFLLIPRRHQADELHPGEANSEGGQGMDPSKRVPAGLENRRSQRRSAAEKADDEGGDPEELEALLNAMEQLQPADEEVLDEDEVKEVPATMVRNYGKGNGKRSHKAVHDGKKAKGLARGYGLNRDPSGRFGQADACVFLLHCMNGAQTVILLPSKGSSGWQQMIFYWR